MKWLKIEIRIKHEIGNLSSRTKSKVLLKICIVQVGCVRANDTIASRTGIESNRNLPFPRNFANYFPDIFPKDQRLLCIF